MRVDRVSVALDGLTLLAVDLDLGKGSPYTGTRHSLARPVTIAAHGSQALVLTFAIVDCRRARAATPMLQVAGVVTGKHLSQSRADNELVWIKTYLPDC